MIFKSVDKTFRNKNQKLTSTTRMERNVSVSFFPVILQDILNVLEFAPEEKQ